MAVLGRSGLGLCLGAALGDTVLTLSCGRERPGAGRRLWRTARPARQGKAPALPKAGPLAAPRSLHQVGLPAELTRAAIAADNLQVPEKIALGERLFFEGRLSADGRVARATGHDPGSFSLDGIAPIV